MEETHVEVVEKSNIIENVIEAIAEVEETDPIALTRPLYEVIDPDALENLFTDNQTIGKVVFFYNRCEVTVFSDGNISVK